MTSCTSLPRVVLLIALFCAVSEPASTRPPPASEPKKSRQDLEKAAARGDAEAQFQLGVLEQHAKDTFEGLRNALPWFRKAARQGHARAQYELGRACFEKMGEERNLPLALKWLTRAAEQGHAEAWLVLGHLNAEGGPGVLQDIARARECYQKANEKSNGEIWSSLGGVYRWGRGGIAADWPRSLDFYLKAARAGDRESQYIVGQFYQYGIGAAEDLPKSVSWYHKAARQSDYRAEEQLGWLYEHGIGVPRDRQQALAWYKKSEQHGGSCWSHLKRLGDPETLKSMQSSGKPDPSTKDIEITLEPEKTEYEMDDLIVIAVRYRNVGKENYSITRNLTGGFHRLFSVQDEKGRELPNSYIDPPGRIHFGSFRMSSHDLEPGTTHVVRETLNQCVHFDKPGTYTIRKQGWVHRVKREGDDEGGRAVDVKPITLKVRRGDPKKRQADIDRLVKAFREGRAFPAGMTKPAEHFAGELDSLRRLVFYNEPKLLPVFLDVLEQGYGSDFAETALRAMPSQAAVLKALEQRLEHPEKHHSLDLLHPYLRLAGLVDIDMFGEPGRLDKWKRQEEITRKYQDKALQLLRGDRIYQYAYLVPGLLGGGDDLFLIDYLIQSRPSLHLVYQCAGTLQKVKLGCEHVPFLKSQLAAQKGWSITDAIILQLVRLEGTRHLAELKAHRDNFSPAIIKLLLEPVEE